MTDLSQNYRLGGMEEINGVTYRWHFDNRALGMLMYSENDESARLKHFSETSENFRDYIESQALESSNTKRNAPQKSEHPYTHGSGHFILLKKDQRGAIVDRIPLCNFIATIVQAITYDDGTEQKKVFKIDGMHEHGKRFPQIIVPVEQFSRMDWVAQWDGRAVVHVGNYLKDHTRAAI